MASPDGEAMMTDTEECLTGGCGSSSGRFPETDRRIYRNADRVMRVRFILRVILSCAAGFEDGDQKTGGFCPEFAEGALYGGDLRRGDHTEAAVVISGDADVFRYLKTMPFKDIQAGEGDHIRCADNGFRPAVCRQLSDLCGGTRRGSINVIIIRTVGSVHALVIILLIELQAVSFKGIGHALKALCAVICFFPDSLVAHADVGESGDPFIYQGLRHDGDGFAVVADEVGNLAKKSQEAARDTAKLIEDTIEAINKGAGITDETAVALNKVSESFIRIDELVSKISEASEQQNVGVQQVTEGIDQISSVVQTNSATAEESAAASQELSSQAEKLDGLVNKFQLKN